MTCPRLQGWMRKAESTSHPIGAGHQLSFVLETSECLGEVMLKPPYLGSTEGQTPSWGP